MLASDVHPFLHPCICLPPNNPNTRRPPPLGKAPRRPVAHGIYAFATTSVALLLRRKPRSNPRRTNSSCICGQGCPRPRLRWSTALGVAFVHACMYARTHTTAVRTTVPSFGSRANGHTDIFQSKPRLDFIVPSLRGGERKTETPDRTYPHLSLHDTQDSTNRPRRPRSTPHPGGHARQNESTTPPFRPPRHEKKKHC